MYQRHVFWQDPAGHGFLISARKDNALGISCIQLFFTVYPGRNALMDVTFKLLALG